MSSAHEITIALSRNNAQSDNIRAAPETNFEFKERFFTRFTPFNTVFVQVE